MGETGCGKTRLISFLCRLKAGGHQTKQGREKKSPQNMLLMKVNAQDKKQKSPHSYPSSLSAPLPFIVPFLLCVPYPIFFFVSFLAVQVVRSPSTL